MREQGTFETDLGIGRGRIHFGKREGKPFSQLSFIDVGDMNNDCEKTVPDGEKVEITILLNGMPATILLWPEKQKGSFTIPSIGFHRELSLQLVSEESGFAGHHFIVPEPNIERLKAHQDYIEEPGEKVLRFELGNPQVLAYVKGQGMTWATKIRVMIMVTILMSIGFTMMFLKAVYIPCIILACVWIFHVLYFIFGVKTYIPKE